MSPVAKFPPTNELRAKNHYLPIMYLKNWAIDNKVSTYDLLVPHESVPLWKNQSIRGIGYRGHLYTYFTKNGHSDIFELWLSENFESPAQAAIQKVLKSQRLQKEDWYHLIRFLAAQDVRTPARFHEFVQRHEKSLQKNLEESLQTSVSELENFLRNKQSPPQPAPQNALIENPFKISTQKRNDNDEGYCKAEVVLGRKFWLYFSEQILTETLHCLHKHKWTIFEAPSGISWLTSDKPVIRLNYYQLNKYDFKGGWNNPGSEIIFPLSPKHLLFTQVGRRSTKRREIASERFAHQINCFIAEHAHRHIFAITPRELVQIRPRKVSLETFRQEMQDWEAWDQRQSAAESELTKHTS